jgi:hypothetical protein
MAVQEASLAGLSGHRLLHHITAAKLHEEAIPGAQCMCIRGYICIYVVPAPCVPIDRGGVPPPPAESGGEALPPETAAGPELAWKKIREL